MSNGEAEPRRSATRGHRNSIMAILFSLPLVGPVAAQPVARKPSPAAFATLVQQGKTLDYQVLVKSGGGAERISSAKIRLKVKSVKKVNGGELAEIQAEVLGNPTGDELSTCSWGPGAKRWFAVTTKGVYDLGLKMPNAEDLAEQLRRGPDWPAKVTRKRCKPAVAEPGVSKPGQPGYQLIDGRRAICRCTIADSAMGHEESEDCIDPDLGIVRSHRVDKPSVCTLMLVPASQ